MINRNSFAYRAGRLAGKFVLLGLGLIIGKRLSQKPIKDSFPKKNK